MFFRSFYSVLLGYCAYYSFFFLVKELPNQLEIAEGHFDDLIVCYIKTTMKALVYLFYRIAVFLSYVILLVSFWLVFLFQEVCQLLNLLIVSLYQLYCSLWSSPFTGHSTYPTLVWVSSICSHPAGVSQILDTFKNNYVDIIESFGDAELWRDALTQNAWDTGSSNI